MSLWRRKPAPGLVHPSDRGAQYTSLRFGARLRQAGILASMGRRGDAYEDALCEAFFAPLDREVLSRCRFRTHDEARSTVFAYLGGVLQPPAQALGPGVPVAGGVREEVVSGI